MEKERERAEKNGYPSPIQPTKAATDVDYDKAIRFCIDNIDRISICAGTHNERSSFLLTEIMKENQVLENDQRVYFSQLLGMSDHISYNLSKVNFNVAKYVPYLKLTSLPFPLRCQTGIQLIMRLLTMTT